MEKEFTRLTPRQDHPGLKAELQPSTLDSEPKHQKTEPDDARIANDFRQLLGPLVSENLRDAKGALDLQILKEKKFQDFQAFKKFLADQARLNDNKVFRNPYQSLLEGPDFESLLRYLYRQIDPTQHSILNSAGAELRVKEFQAALIEIDAEAFARNFSGSKEGRRLLNSILAQDSPLSKDQRADLIKGIYEVGEEKNVVCAVDYARVTENISPWNYFNLWVTEKELQIAQDGAESILRSLEFYAEQAEKNQKNLNRDPSAMARVLVDGELRNLPEEKVERFRRMAEEKPFETGAIAQVQGDLARLWTFAANERNFDQKGWRPFGGNLDYEETQAMRRHVLRKTEELVTLAGRMETKADFEYFHGELRKFLKDPVDFEGESKILGWLEHQIRGTALSDYLSKMPAEVRKPLDGLVYLSDSWEYSVLKMGRPINLKPFELRAREEELRQKVATMINGLERTRDGLWYGYKEHKSLSRGLSQIASLFNAGDTQDIEAAQVTLGSLIYQLSEAVDEQDIKEIYLKLVEELEAGGTLHKALDAAEMDGAEHVLGLGQTVAEMAALAGLTRGLSLIGPLANGFVKGKNALQLVKATAPVVQAATRTERMTKGLWLGAALSTSENALALATGEVRHGSETVHKWFVDAVATGIAMGITAGAVPQFGKLPPTQQNLIKNLWLRYTAGGMKGIGHLGADTGLEIFEETLDQYLNQVLNGDPSALTESEFTELALICTAGGGVKVGILAEHVKGQQKTTDHGQRTTDQEDVGADEENPLPFVRGGSGRGRGNALAETDALPPPNPLLTKEGEKVTPANDNSKTALKWAAAAAAVLGITFDNLSDAWAGIQPLAETHSKTGVGLAAGLATFLLGMAISRGKKSEGKLTREQKAKSIQEHYFLSLSGHPEKSWPDLWERYQGMRKVEMWGWGDPKGEFFDFFLNELGLHHPFIESLMKYETNKYFALPDESGIGKKLLRTIFNLKFFSRTNPKSRLGRFLWHFIEQEEATFAVGKMLLSCIGRDAVFDDAWALNVEALEDPDPLVRYFALQNFIYFFNRPQEDLEPWRIAEVIDSAYRGILEANPAIVKSNWIILTQLDPEKAKIIPESFFSNRPSPSLQASSQFQMPRYIYGTPMEKTPGLDILGNAVFGGFQPGILHISEINPIHSLADFQPDTRLRAPILKRKYAALKRLIGKLGHDREKVLATYFKNGPGVLKIEDQYYLVDGHHRLAVLIQAAVNEAIPKTWLKEPIPVRVYSEQLSYPPALARYLVTLGVNLTWKDLFPAKVSLRPGWKEIFGDENESSGRGPSSGGSFPLTMVTALGAGLATLLGTSNAHAQESDGTSPLLDIGPRAIAWLALSLFIGVPFVSHLIRQWKLRGFRNRVERVSDSEFQDLTEIRQVIKDLKETTALPTSKKLDLLLTISKNPHLREDLDLYHQILSIPLEWFERALEENVPQLKKDAAKWNTLILMEQARFFQNVLENSPTLSVEEVLFLFEKIQRDSSTPNLHAFAAPALLGLDFLLHGQPTFSGIALSALASGILMMSLKGKGKEEPANPRLKKGLDLAGRVEEAEARQALEDLLNQNLGKWASENFLALSLKLIDYIPHPEKEVQHWAENWIEDLYLLMDEEEKKVLIDRSSEKLLDPDPAVQEAGVFLLNIYTQETSSQKMRDLFWKILPGLAGMHREVREEAFDFIRNNFTSLQIEDRTEWTLALPPLLGDPQEEVRESVFEALWFTLFFLRTHEARQALAEKLNAAMGPHLIPVEKTQIENMIFYLRLSEKDPTEPLVFSKLGLMRIRFSDGGMGTSSIPAAFTRLLDLPPQKGHLNIEFAGDDLMPLEASLREFLAGQEADGEGEKIGRSVVYQMKQGLELVLKYPRDGQSGEDLLRELKWLHEIRKVPELRARLRGLIEQSYPKLVGDEKSPLGLLKIKDGNNTSEAITFKAHPDYYRYLDDPELSDEEFLQGLKGAIHDVFTLDLFDVYHTVPLKLFHNAQGENRLDAGRYVIAPDVVFRFIPPLGMGRLDNWPQALRHGNFGLTGLRDFEELATLEEIMRDIRPMPELKPLHHQPDGEQRYRAMLLGNALFAATLYIGNRIRQQTSDDEGTIPHWKNDAWLQKYADWLLEIYATGYAAHRNLKIEEAKSTLRPRADWLRFARQLAFFMTPAYVPFVREGELAEDFPQEIYGPNVVVQGGRALSRKVMGPYRPGTFHPDLGFLGPDGDPEKLTLGPVNGQNPIKEFEKAWAAMLFGPERATRVRMPEDSMPGTPARPNPNKGNDPGAFVVAGPVIPVIETLLNDQPSLTGFLLGGLTMLAGSGMAMGIFSRLFRWMKGDRRTETEVEPDAESPRAVKNGNVGGPYRGNLEPLIKELYQMEVKFLKAFNREYYFAQKNKYWVWKEYSRSLELLEKYVETLKALPNGEFKLRRSRAMLQKIFDLTEGKRGDKIAYFPIRGAMALGVIAEAFADDKPSLNKILDKLLELAASSEWRVTWATLDPLATIHPLFKEDPVRLKLIFKRLQRNLSENIIKDEILLVCASLVHSLAAAGDWAKVQKIVKIILKNNVSWIHSAFRDRILEELLALRESVRKEPKNMKNILDGLDQAIQTYSERSEGPQNLHALAAPALLGLDFLLHSQPTFTGILLTALATGLGILGMVAGKKGDDRDSISDKKQKWMEHIFQTYPSIHHGLDSANLTTKEKWEFLNLVAKKAGARTHRHPVYSSLFWVFEELERTNWSPEQKHQLLLMAIKNVTHLDGLPGVFKDLIDFLRLMRMQRFTDEQQYHLFILLVGKFGKDFHASAQSLPDLMEAMRGWTAEQKYRLLADMAEREPDTQGPASPFLNAHRALQAMRWAGLSFEQGSEILALVAGRKLLFYYPGGKYAALEKGLEGLEESRWSPEEKYRFLASAAKSSKDYGSAFASLRHAFHTSLKTSWSFEQESRFLVDLSKKIVEPSGRNDLPHAFRLARHVMNLTRPDQAERAKRMVFRILDRLTKYNREAVLELLRRSCDDFTKNESEPFLDRLEFYADIFEHRPRLGLNILEGLIEATRQGIVPLDLKAHREKILHFIDQTNGFHPALYVAYLAEGEPLFAELRERVRQILDDHIGWEESHRIKKEKGAAYLLGLIQMASPPSGMSFVPRSRQAELLQLVLEKGDLRRHIPQTWWGKVESIEVGEEDWRLKPGKTADPAGKIARILGLLRASRERNKRGEKEALDALLRYLHSGRSLEDRSAVLEAFYRYAGRDEALREKIRRIQGIGHGDLQILEHLFTDKDALPKILEGLLDQIPAELLSGPGAKRKLGFNLNGFTKRLRKTWKKLHEDQKLSQNERLGVLSKFISPYEEGEIREKLLTRADLGEDLKVAILQVMHEGPALDKRRLIVEILSEAVRPIKEERAKYAYQEIGRKKLGLRVVKGPPYGLAGLTSGVCTAGDLSLWEDKNFMLLAIIDESKGQAVGYVHLLEVRSYGKKVLTLPGINPSAEFLSTVDGGELYEALIPKIIEFARVGGYEAVYIPAEPLIHGNLSEISEAIARQSYPSKIIPTVLWNKLPEPYPFSEVFVVWEKAKETEVPPLKVRGGQEGLFSLAAPALLGLDFLLHGQPTTTGLLLAGATTALGILGMAISKQHGDSPGESGHEAFAEFEEMMEQFLDESSVADEKIYQETRTILAAIPSEASEARGILVGRLVQIVRERLEPAFQPMTLRELAVTLGAGGFFEEAEQVLLYGRFHANEWSARHPDTWQQQEITARFTLAELAFEQERAEDVANPLYQLSLLEEPFQYLALSKFLQHLARNNELHRAAPLFEKFAAGIDLEAIPPEEVEKMRNLLFDMLASFTYWKSGRGGFGGAPMATAAAVGGGLAVLLGTDAAHAALGAVESGGFNVFTSGLTAFALGSVLSRVVGWIQGWWSQGKYRSAEHWDPSLVMGRMLQDATAAQVRAFVTSQFPGDPLSQLAWLEDYRIQAAKEILADPEAFLAEAAQGKKFSDDDLFKLRVKIAEVLQALGEKKQVLDYLHMVFSNLSQGLSYHDLFPNLGGKFHVDPTMQEIFLRLMAKGIYPYFLKDLDPGAQLSMQLIMSYHQIKKGLFPSDPSGWKQNPRKGWEALFSSHLLDESDRDHLTEGLIQTLGKKRVLAELHLALRNPETAPVAAWVLDRIDPEWDQPLRRHR